MRLTDAQIEKARKSISGWVSGMKSGKYIRNSYDYTRNKDNKIMIFIGIRNIRQIIRIINDLKYYKARISELESELNELKKASEETGKEVA